MFIHVNVNFPKIAILQISVYSKTSEGKILRILVCNKNKIDSSFILN